MIRRPPRSTQSRSSAASDVYKRQAYPLSVFEALQAKAMDDVREIRERILHGERLANAGRDPEAGGWTMENALWFIARHGPLTSEDLRRPSTVSYTHLRAHETRHDLVCRLLL